MKTGTRVHVMSGDHAGRLGTVVDLDAAYSAFFPGPKAGQSLVRLDAEAGQPRGADGTPGRGGRGGATFLVDNNIMEEILELPVGETRMPHNITCRMITFPVDGVLDGNGFTLFVDQMILRRGTRTIFYGVRP